MNNRTIMASRVIIQMSVRQVRRKQSSITIQHPSTSLHLVQIAKFIQDYQHARMLYNINFNTAIVQTMLAQTQQSQQEFNMSLDVPYIQSEHYESNNTFTDSQHIEQSSHQNFTDEEENEEENMQQNMEERTMMRKKMVLQEVQEEFKQQDFKFVSRQSNSQQNGNTSFPFNSTKNSYEEQKPQSGRNEQVEIYRMQQTAYFSQAPQNDRRFSVQSMNESTKQNKPGTHNRNEQAKSSNGWSKKAMFLNKIEKQKSRKEIAQFINKERHHLKRFLK